MHLYLQLPIHSEFWHQKYQYEKSYSINEYSYQDLTKYRKVMRVYELNK